MYFCILKNAKPAACRKLQTFTNIYLNSAYQTSSSFASTSKPRETKPNTLSTHSRLRVFLKVWQTCGWTLTTTKSKSGSGNKSSSMHNVTIKVNIVQTNRKPKAGAYGKKGFVDFLCRNVWVHLVHNVNAFNCRTSHLSVILTFYLFGLYY